MLWCGKGFFGWGAGVRNGYGRWRSGGYEWGRGRGRVWWLGGDWGCDRVGSGGESVLCVCMCEGRGRGGEYEMGVRVVVWV